MNTNDCKTNPNFWDCKCEENYITHKSIGCCSKCGADQEDQPDSIQFEIDNR